MKLRVYNKLSHEGLWGWLGNNPEKDKEAWPGFVTMRKLKLKLPFVFCFACAEAGYKTRYRARYKYYCQNCPVNFGVSLLEKNESIRRQCLVCTSASSLYAKWETSYYDRKEVVRTAFKIARGWK